MNSTFKYWEANGNTAPGQFLTANGVDTVNFVGATGIYISMDANAVPQQVTIGLTGAGFAGSSYWTQTGNQLYPTTIANNVGIGTQGATGYALDVNGILNTNADALINTLTVGKGKGNISTNTVLGLNALSSNISGLYNTAIGDNALQNNTVGLSNTAIGNAALQNNITTSYNTAIGNAALQNNTLGTDNTAIGVNAGKLLSGNSSYNTFLGGNTDLSSPSLIYNNSTAVGYGAIIDASNQMVLGTINEKVKIPGSYVGINGVYNPSSGFTLDVSGNLRTTMDASINSVTVGRGGGSNNQYNIVVGVNSLQTNNLGSYNTAVGYNSLYSNVDGSFNTAIGDGSLQNNNNGFDNVAVGHVSLQSNTTGPYNTAIGSGSLRENISGSDNTAIGHVSVFNNITGNFNTAIGSASLSNNIVDGNTAIGAYSLQSNTDGSYNVAVGFNSLKLNTRGSYNVALGKDSLYSNVDGSYNVAVGYEALRNNTSGSINTALGFSSLYNNTTGTYNTAIGFDSLYNNTTTSSNTAIGYNSLFYNIANNNTAVGWSSLANNTTGSANVAFGYCSLVANITGNSNTAIGFSSLANNKAGGNNTAIGTNSLLNNTIGGDNTAIGADAAVDLSGNSSYNTFLGHKANVDLSLNIYNNSTALGYNSIIDASNQMVLGGVLSGSYPGIKIPGSYVGINGVYNPASGYALDVSGVLHTNTDALINSLTVGRGGGNNNTNTVFGYQALSQNTSTASNTYNTVVGYQSGYALTACISNTSVGYQALYQNLTGSYNTSIGYISGTGLTSGGNNTFLGEQTQTSNSSVSYSTAIGYTATITDSNQIVLGTSNEKVKIPGSYVGINTYNPTSGYALDVSGTLHTNSDAYINGVTVGRGSGNSSQNTTFGLNALLNNIVTSTTGLGNVAVGESALRANTNGNANTAVGRYSLPVNTTGGENTAVGKFTLYYNTTGSHNSAFGHQALKEVINGCNNTGIGDFAGAIIADGSNNTCVGHNAQPSTSSINNEITLGDNTIATLRCQQTTITSLSDARDKKDIQPLENGLTFVEKLNPVSFIWNMRDGCKVDIPEMGFIAQDLQQVQKDTGITVPGLVYDVNPDKLEASYGRLFPLLVKAVQELSAEVKALKNPI